MQQAFVISLFLVVAFIASAVIGDFFFLVLTPLAALGLGWWLGSRYSELRPSGSWIGLLPGAFWLFTFFQEWSRGWRGARELIAYDRGEGAWALFLFTIPAVICVTYSLGVWLSRNWPQRAPA